MLLGNWKWRAASAARAGCHIKPMQSVLVSQTPLPTPGVCQESHFGLVVLQLSLPARPSLLFACGWFCSGP